jgi:hypothetical protein
MSWTDGTKTTTDGQAPDGTTAGAPKPIGANGQHEAYYVLTEEERAKGFVRPVRKSYRHVGPAGPAGELRELTAEEIERHKVLGYVAFEAYGPDRAPVTGRFWTQAQLDAVKKGGCGQVTSMGLSIAETYARQPSFYGSTFCVTCGKHLLVGAQGEFVWVENDGRDGGRVGT